VGRGPVTWNGTHHRITESSDGLIELLMHTLEQKLNELTPLDTGGHVHRRMVSPQPTRADQSAARRAQQTHPGALQLLRRQRELSKSPAAAAGSAAHLVQMALSSEPTNASQFRKDFASYSSAFRSRAPESESEDGPCPTSRISGRAVWWKSPRKKPVACQAAGLMSTR
jgi:hypothetical protein